jgi:PEP-CTERM motif
LAALALLFGGAGQACADIIYNNAADFSPTNNPNGVWSYGYLAPGLTPLASTFILYTATSTLGSTIQNWSPSSASRNPDDFYNSSNAPATFSTLTLQAKEAAFHPGPNGEYSVYRFTAPSSGLYNLSAIFTTRDTVGPAAPDDIYVLDNGVQIFANFLPTSYGSSESYATTLSLKSGDTVDFVVGDLDGTNFGFNTTGLNATLTATPEPASLALLGIGCASLATYCWRRRKLALA